MSTEVRQRQLVWGCRSWVNQWDDGRLPRCRHEPVNAHLNFFQPALHNTPSSDMAHDFMATTTMSERTGLRVHEPSFSSS